jgi:transmembrane sensor
VEELISKYLAGETSATEEKQLLDWIALRPENEQVYLQFKKIFELSQKHLTTKSSQDPEINIDAEWAEFVSQLSSKVIKMPKVPALPRAPRGELVEGVEEAEETQANRSNKVWFRIAAVILLLVASGFLINYFISKSKDFEYQTADNTLTIFLPDSSHVILNQHSKLSYSSTFGETSRTITLEGEGFFEITHDASKPFVINANHSRVEVLGTSFDVRAYPGQKETEVIVQTGVVKFSVPEIKDEVKLTAGHKGIFVSGTSQITDLANTDSNFLSWNTRRISFTENDLQSVIETLNKTYHADIVLSADVSPTCVVTVSFDHQTLDAVLNVLQTTLNLTYRKTGNKIEITHAGC